MNSKYGEWKLVQFPQLVSDVAVLKRICSHLKTKVIHLISLISKTSFYCWLLPSGSTMVKYKL